MTEIAEVEADLPQLPPEIVDQILSQLEWTDDDVLRSCRCVSKLWNELSIATLRKYYWPTLLNCKQIKNFVDFVGWNTKEKKGATLPAGLRYGISIWDDDGDLVECKSVLEDIELFLSFTGFEAITCLKLRICDKLSGTHSLLVILEELSSHLLWLTVVVKPYTIGESIHSSTIQTSPTSVQLKSILDLLRQNQNLSFPKLEKLSCGSLRAPVHTKDEIELVSNLTMRSPNLVEFDFNGKFTFPDFSFKIPFGSIKTLKLAELRQNSSLDLLNQVKACPVKPKLRNFEHDFFVAGTDPNFEQLKLNLTDVLNEFSETLKSLTQNFYGFEVFTCIRFPILPILKEWRIRVLPQSWTLLEFEYLDWDFFFDGSMYLDVFTMNLSQNTLPALKFVDIPMAFFWRTKDSTDCNKFQSVTSLNIQVHNLLSGFPQVIDEFFEHVFTIFPNLTQVSLENLGYQKKNRHISKAVRSLLKAPQAKQIKVLEFLNYNYDYMGEALIGLNAMAKQMCLTLVGMPNRNIENAELLLLHEFRQFDEFDPANLVITRSSDILSNSYTVTATLSHKSNNNLKEIQKLKLRGQKFKENLPFKLDFQINNDDTNLTPNQEEETKLLRLMTLQEHMPALQALEFSPDILSSSGHISACNCVKEIQKNFPQWNVTFC